MNAEVRGIAPDTRYTHVLYALHLLAPFTLWTLAVVAIVMGMIKRGDVSGTYLDSHFSWLSRTFWWGLLWLAITCVITWILILTVIGIVVAWVPSVILFIWYLYRVVKGWIALNDAKAIA